MASQLSQDQVVCGVNATTEVSQEELNQFLEINREMHGTISRMNGIFERFLSLMEKEPAVNIADLESGMHDRPLDSAPAGYRLRAAPTSFKTGEGDLAGNLRWSRTFDASNENRTLGRRDTGVESTSLWYTKDPRALRRGTDHIEIDFDETGSAIPSGTDAETVDFEQPFTKRAMSFILKQKLPDVEEYEAHFREAQEIKTNLQPSHCMENIDWKQAIVLCINASAPLNCSEKNKLQADLFNKYATALMCSLYLSETSYPYFKNMSKAEFEIMHAPRLYEFLESTMAPYAWRSEQVISHFHPLLQNFGWDVALPIVCQTGLALQRAQQEQSTEYQYYTSSKEDSKGDTMSKRFELILENQCVQAGLLPETRDGQGKFSWRVNLRHESAYWLGEKIRRDFIEDDPGLSHAPKIQLNAKYYHGATYVPKPDPKDNIMNNYEDLWSMDDQKVSERNTRNEILRASPTFEPIDLALENIKAVKKDWSIVWTSNLAEHLWVQDSQIFVYWCPTNLMHHPRGPGSLEVEELRKTYALLFASTRQKFSNQRQRMVREADKYSVNDRSLKPFEKVGRTLVPIRPLERPYKHLLNAWLDTPCPHHITQVFAHTSSRTGLIPEMTIGDVLAFHPANIPEDLLFQLQGVLLYPHQTTGEYYSNYPYFGKRLRYLNYVLQNQKPRSLTELWRDQRDSLQWWTFWLVVWFGIASVVLALGSLVEGAVQTWAAFRGLGLN